MKLNFHMLLILGMGLIVTEVGAIRSSHADEAKPLPRIEAASVPLYPIAAQAARISGKVVLEISTNGKEVSTVEVKSGPAMLVQAAKENVATWHFKPGHRPADYFRGNFSISNCRTGKLLLREWNCVAQTSNFR
jgi:hypothetical protein